MGKDIVNFLNEKKNLEFQISELLKKDRLETEDIVLNEMNGRLQTINALIEKYNQSYNH